MTSDPLVCVFPHSDDEFLTAEELRDFLTSQLPAGGGEYCLGKVGWKDKDFRVRVVPGSLVLFRKGSVIVGDAVVQRPIIKLDPPRHDLTRCGIPTTYFHEIVFDPNSVRAYPTDVQVSAIEGWSGRQLAPRFYAIIGFRRDYEKTVLGRYQHG